MMKTIQDSEVVNIGHIQAWLGAVAGTKILLPL
jgi:hypothetical protein